MMNAINERAEEKQRIFTADRETGTFIDEAATIEEARRLIEGYEQEDRENGEYTADFYNIVDQNHVSIDR